jgi:hypothetical protein
MSHKGKSSSRAPTIKSEPTDPGLRVSAASAPKRNHPSCNTAHGKAKVNEQHGKLKCLIFLNIQFDLPFQLATPPNLGDVPKSASQSSNTLTGATNRIRPTPVPANPSSSAAAPIPYAPNYITYASHQDISYEPEEALRQGLGMLRAIKHGVKKLEMGSKLRKEVWLREIER